MNMEYATYKIYLPALINKTEFDRPKSNTIINCAIKLVLLLRLIVIKWKNFSFRNKVIFLNILATT